MYPSIDLSYKPGVYSYTYLLSPASTWAKFGRLNIDINTPFYMTESDKRSFVKTNSGYSYTSDGLPEGELNFSLSESAHPESTRDGMGIIYFFMILLLGVVPFILAAIFVIVSAFVILRIVKKRRKGKE